MEIVRGSSERLVAADADADTGIIASSLSCKGASSPVKLFMSVVSDDALFIMLNDVFNLVS
jgi:hypothetical protein